MMEWYLQRTGSKITKSTMRGYLQNLEDEGYKVVRPYFNGMKKEEEPEIDESLTKKQHFDLVWDAYRELIGMSKNHKPPKMPKSRVGRRRKLCIASDSHGDPYLKGVIGICNEKPDLILLAGDIMDCLAVSRFEKPNYIPIEKEVANVRAMLEQFCSVAPVRMCRGNHDIRALRYFLQKLDPQVVASFRAIGVINPDILSITATGLKNCEVVSNMHGFHTVGGDNLINAMAEEWMIVEGDAVFMHAEKARKGELSTARAIATEWYASWKKLLDLPDARVLAQAHVHTAGVGYSNGGHQILIELGCMTNPSVLQYQLNGDLKYRPPTIGYTVMEQDKKDGKWITDPTSIRFIPL
jgi:hypothetical protein